MTEQAQLKEWITVPLSYVTDFQNGFAFKSSTYRESGAFVIRIGNVQTDGISLNNPAYVDAADLGADNFLLRNGDMLISLTGNVGRVAIIKTKHLPAVLNQRVARVFPSKSIENNFLFHLIRSGVVQKELLASAKGAAQLNISTKDLARIDVPLPALAEQKVIADKLDTLLAQVETTKARLDRIPQILKRFRQSVLAAAVSGRLTEEWRGEQDYRYLDLQLSKSDGTTLYPARWRATSLSDVCQVISGNAFKSGDFVKEGGVPAIKISNVQYGVFEVKNQEYLPEFFLHEYKRYEVIPDDLLMALTRPITNDTLKICRYPLSAPKALLNQRVAKFLFSDYRDKAFLELVFQSDYFKLQVYDKLSETLQPNLSPVDLKKFLVAVPPSEEQIQIVHQAEQLFAHVDRIEQQVQAAQERVNNLTQSILAKAFRGELTEQWRKDNPELISGENSATALLERIQAERAPNNKTRKTPRPAKKPS